LSNVQNKKCLDVEGGNDEEGRNVIVWGRHNGNNQRWKIVYLDKAPKEPTEGLNKEYGMYINRPFYLVSRLWMKRVVECHGANNLTINRYTKGKLQQQYFFDQKSKTIRSQLWKNYMLYGNPIKCGNSNNLRE
jgi:hypothetical protein